MNRSLVFAMAAVVGLALGPLAGAADDQAALAKQAKISKEKAQEIALKKAPGTVESSELEKEKGTLVYSFDIKTAQGGRTEVLVSAIDGHIVDVSHETAAKEAAEKKKEAHEKKQSQTKTTHH